MTVPLRSSFFTLPTIRPVPAGPVMVGLPASAVQLPSFVLRLPAITPIPMPAPQPKPRAPLVQAPPAVFYARPMTPAPIAQPKAAPPLVQAPPAVSYARPMTPDSLPTAPLADVAPQPVQVPAALPPPPRPAPPLPPSAFFNVPALQRAAIMRQFYLGADPSTVTDIPTLRLVAARDLGLTAAFEGRTSKSFTGSRADYALLTAPEQEALTDRMLQLIRDNPDQFTAQQVAVANAQTRPFAQPTALEQKSLVTAAAEGAAQGAANAANFAQDLIAGASSTAGKALSNILGGTLSGTLTKLALVVVGGAVLYIVITRGIKPAALKP